MPETIITTQGELIIRCPICCSEFRTRDLPVTVQFSSLQKTPKEKYKSIRDGKIIPFRKES
jgi:hypothetical protein